MAQHCLGVDFGTSNSAASYLCHGTPRLIKVAAGQTTLPSTFFFDFENRKTLMGGPANQALLDGADGDLFGIRQHVELVAFCHSCRHALTVV